MKKHCGKIWLTSLWLIIKKGCVGPSLALLICQFQEKASTILDLTFKIISLMLTLQIVHNDSTFYSAPTVHNQYLLIIIQTTQ